MIKITWLHEIRNNLAPLVLAIYRYSSSADLLTELFKFTMKVMRSQRSAKVDLIKNLEKYSNSSRGMRLRASKEVRLI